MMIFSLKSKTSLKLSLRFASSVVIRRQMAPLVKLIHPDIFATSTADIKRKNLQFLQSLNELSDTIQSMIDMTERRGSLDVIHPLSPSYRFTFYVKDNTTAQLIEENGVRSVTAAMIIPTQFTARRTLARDPAEAAMRKLLIQLGNLLTAVDLNNPWNVRQGEAAESEDSNDNRVKRNARSTGDKNSVPDWVFSEKFARRADSKDAEGMRAMDHFKKQVEVAVEERIVEKDVLHRWDRRRVSPASYASSLLADMGRAPGGEDLCRGKGRMAQQRRGNASSGISDQEVHLMLEVDRYVRNGNVLVSNSPSRVEELAALRRLNAFLTEFGGLISFSFKHWSGVIFILNGETSGTIDRKESNSPSRPIGGKKSATERHERLYQVETLAPTPSAARANDNNANHDGCLGALNSDADGSTDGGKKERRLDRVVVTIPFNFKTRTLLKHLSKNVPHAALLSGARLKRDSLI